MHKPSPATTERCITCGETREVISFLEQHPEVMHDQDKEGNAIFSRVVRTQNIHLINWLLKKGVDLWATNKYGQTALHRAFVIRAGEVSALLYYYEKLIPGNPMEAKNDLEYASVFLAPPDPRILTKEWHQAQIQIFRETMDELCRNRATLPEATFRIAIEQIDKLNRESRSLSDSSGGSSAAGGAVDSTDSGLHHRGSGSGGSSTDEKETSFLLAKTTFRAAAAGTPPDATSKACDL